MPTTKYVDCLCDICGEEWEVLFQFKLPDSCPCPNCEHPTDLRFVPDSDDGDDEDDTQILAGC